MPSSQLQEQILIVNALEKFIFEKIRSTPFLGSHKSILMASNEEDLRKAIYTLHDEGLFRESEEDKIKRLCKDLVKAYFPDKNGNYEVEKLDCEYLPKHYDEIIQAIRSFHCTVEARNHDEIERLYRTLLRDYSTHRDCYNLKDIPESLQQTIHQIQNSFLSQEADKIKEKAYIDFVKEFIKKYEYDHVFLWNALNFSRQDQNTLKELSFLSFRFIGPLKNKFAIRQLNSKIQSLKPKKNILFEQLMEYLDKKATAYVREILIQMYDQKEKTYKKQQGNIDKLLQTYFKKYQTKILNRKQQVKIIAKIKTKFNPQIIQILEDKQEKKQQQLAFKVQLQKHIVRNLTNSSTGTISSEPVYDPYLFTPTASIHDANALTELKTKATRNKSAKKQKGFQTQEHPTTQPKRNFIGDTKRMLKKNHEIYQSLKNLLND
ncbi:hypothetical protein [Acinetobacter haemolyticus]